MKDAPRAAVVVLGMHRSGTSAVMRVLNLLGVDIGDRLLPPSTGNEFGFWEHRDIVETHESLLDGLGTSWDDVRPLPEEWWTSSEIAPHRQKLIDIIERDFSDSSLWGFKDPRTCRLLPLWKGILHETQSAPHFVIVVRNPAEVVSSLAKRDGFPAGKSHLLWLRHVIESERETRNFPRVFVAYEDLLSDWSEAARTIERTLGIRWRTDLAEAAVAIEAFLQPHLRHHRVGDRDFAEDSNVSAWLRRAYSAIRQATHAEDGAMSGTLDAIRSQLSDAESLYVPVLSELTREKRALEEAKHEPAGNTFARAE